MERWVIPRKDVEWWNWQLSHVKFRKWPSDVSQISCKFANNIANDIANQVCTKRVLTGVRATPSSLRDWVQQMVTRIPTGLET